MKQKIKSKTGLKKLVIIALLLLAVLAQPLSAESYYKISESQLIELESLNQENMKIIQEQQTQLEDLKRIQADLIETQKELIQSYKKSRIKRLIEGLVIGAGVGFVGGVVFTVCATN